MTEKTYQNIEQAFIGEARAYFRLLSFAERAAEEGYPQIARLFRAIALAESAHAKQHFKLLEKVKSTQENLQYCFEKETFVNEVAYPEFLRQAWADQDKAAVWFLTVARNAEERHAKLYKDALSDMIADRSTAYYVCTFCGWIVEEKVPEICPNCGKPADFFSRVE